MHVPVDWRGEELRVARRTSPYEAVGQTNPLNRNAVVVTRPIGTRRATGVTTGPTRRDRAGGAGAERRAQRPGEQQRRAHRASKVPPGTPATAKRPLTRSGCRRASSKAVFTPIDQPATTQRSTPRLSRTATASSTNASTPTRSGSAGRALRPTPAVVPGDDPQAAVGAQQVGPGVGVRAQPVAEQHRRASACAGPRLDPGAVGTRHRREADGARAPRHRGAPRRGARTRAAERDHAPILPHCGPGRAGPRGPHAVERRGQDGQPPRGPRTSGPSRGASLASRRGS